MSEQNDGWYVIRGKDGKLFMSERFTVWKSPDWVVMGSEMEDSEPGGDILAGPFTEQQVCERMMGEKND